MRESMTRSTVIFAIGVACVVAAIPGSKSAASSALLRGSQKPQQLGLTPVPAINVTAYLG